MEFDKSRLGGTVTEDELASASAVVIAIITVCATLAVVARLELGIKTISYSTLVCGRYIVNLIVRMVGHHLNHFIAIAFDIEAFAHTALREERPNDGRGAKVDCLGPSRRRFHGMHLSWMHHEDRGHVHLALPACHAVLVFLHLRRSRHQHESMRHLVPRFKQRGLLPPRGHELSAQRHGQVPGCGGEHPQEF